MSDELFSVCQFLEGDFHEYVRRDVSVAEAMKAARHYASNVAAKMGITKRVIITDDGDCVCWEWIHGQGVTFPPKETPPGAFRSGSGRDGTG